MVGNASPVKSKARAAAVSAEMFLCRDVQVLD